MYEAGKNIEAEKRTMQFSEEEIMETVDYVMEVITNSLAVKPFKNRNECVQYGNQCAYYDHCWQAQKLLSA